MQASFQLLIATLRAGIDPLAKQRLSSAIRQATEEHWQDFLNLCDHHNVSILTRSSLQKNEVWDLLPEFARQTLDDRYHNTVAWSLKLSHSLAQVIPVFEKSGIPVIPWKGPALSQRLYGTIWDREYSDLDLLIPEEHRFAVENLLSELNCRIDENELGGNPPSIGNNNDHCQSYEHTPSGVLHEIHWKPLPGAFRFTRSVDDLHADATPTGFHSISLHQLSLEDEFLLLLAHGAKHHWCQLNWLYDFVIFLQDNRNSLDWDTCRCQIEHLGLIRIMKTATLLSSDILELDLSQYPLPHPVTDPCACRQAAVYSGQLQSSTHSPESQNRLSWKYQWFVNSLLSRERYRDRVPMIISALSYLVTPNLNDRRYCPGVFPLSLGAWLIRPFRIIFKYGLRLVKII